MKDTIYLFVVVERHAPFFGQSEKRKRKRKGKKTRIVAATNLSVKPQQASSLQSSKSFSVISCSEKKRRGEKIGTPKYRLVGLSLSVDGRTFTARR
jgi:hypothetical protein